MTFLKKAFSLLRETAVAFGKNNGSMLAASLAYYTIFAIAPLLVIVLAVAGFVLGDAAVRGQLDSQLEGAVGRDAAVLIEDLVASANQTDAGLFATIVSVLLLLLAASGLFGQLKKALNTIWEVEAEQKGGVVEFVLQRIVAIAMVLLVGVVLLASMSARAAVVLLGDFLAARLPILGLLLPSMEVLVSLIILTLLFAIIFKILPDTSLRWHDLLVGGAVTALLFSIGKYLIGFYLTFNANSPTYQAAGAIVIVLLWIYYSSQIFLFGAQFTCVYAGHHDASGTTEAEASPLESSLQQGKVQVRIAKPVPVKPSMSGQTAVAQPTAPTNDSPKVTAVALLLGTALGLLLAFVGNLFGRKNID